MSSTKAADPPELNVPLAILYFGLDVIAVAFYVLSSRELSGDLVTVLGTGWPFLVAVVVAWAVARAWRHGRRVFMTGIVVWMVTAGLGLALRAVSGGEVTQSFITISAIVLFALILGWRGAAFVLDALFTRGSTPEPPDDYSAQPRPRG